MGDLSNGNEELEQTLIDLPSRLIEDVQRYLTIPAGGDSWEAALGELSQSVGWLIRGLLEEDQTWPEHRAEDGFLVDGDEKPSPSAVRLRGLLTSIKPGAGDCIDPVRATLGLSDSGNALNYEIVLGDADFGLASLGFGQRPRVWLEVDNVKDWILEFRGEVRVSDQTVT